MVILGVYETDFQALFNGPSRVCSHPNAHSQSATGKDHIKSSSITKKGDIIESERGEHAAHCN